MNRSKQSITLHTLSCDDLDFGTIKNIVLNNANIENVKTDIEIERITGIIKKEYQYSAKRSLEDEDISGKSDFKYFRFLIKKQQAGFSIILHYEGRYGAYTNLKNIIIIYLKENDITNYTFATHYRLYKDIKFSDLKKIEYKSEKLYNTSKTLGNWKRTTIELYKINDVTKLGDGNENVSKTKILEFLKINDCDEDRGEKSMILYLKTGKKVNFLDIRNTHFDIDIEYEDYLPRHDLFIRKVEAVLQKINESD